MENRSNRGGGGGGEEKLKQEELTESPAPPSAATSPSHDFTFTISLLPSAAPQLPHNKNRSPPPPSPQPTQPSAAAVAATAPDLSPADDIFFHGHLLPLHFLSHLPVSPRSSTNSLDNFTLPIRDYSSSSQEDPSKPHRNGISKSECILTRNAAPGFDETQPKERFKSKSFSFLGLPRWRKGADDERRPRRKPRFDVLKRYMTMMRPLLLFIRRRRESAPTQRRNYSFSGNLNPGGRQGMMVQGRRGELSAPASMRASPTNSGLLFATAASTNVPCSASDSTMEELQAAIQAAIAHCKNSIAAEEKKLKC